MISEQLIQAWQDIRAEKGPEAAESFYEENIFPRLIDDFAERNRRYRGRYRYLISLVGLSPEPIILTLKALLPEKVLFLYSRESEKYFEKIERFYPMKIAQVDKQRIDPSRVESIYEKIREFVHGLDKKEIAVDITGGKKAMVSGASAAAEFLGCNIFYVDYTRYNADLRKPIPGSEYLNRLENPAEIFGDYRRREGIQLYNSGDYSQAKQIFLDLKRKVMHQEIYELLLQIIYFYENWENYEFDSAKKYGEKALECIEKYRIMSHLEKTLEEQLTLLEKLRNQEKPWLVCNHYFMAQRFYRRKRLDFAALLLYRTIEMAFTFRLNEKYSLNTDSPQYKNPEELLKHYQAMERIAFGDPNKTSNNLPFKIGFINAAILLCVFEDRLISKDQLHELYSHSEIRNKSILAHGTSPIKEKRFNKMNQFFTGLFENFLSIYLPAHPLKILEKNFQPVALDE